jgi:hypothetical protein
VVDLVYQQWPHSAQSHSHGCAQQPIGVIHGSSTGPAGIPYIVDNERCAEHDGQRGCRANLKSRKLMNPLRSILSSHESHRTAGQSEGIDIGYRRPISIEIAE